MEALHALIAKTEKRRRRKKRGGKSNDNKNKKSKNKSNDDNNRDSNNTSNNRSTERWQQQSFPWRKHRCAGYWDKAEGLYFYTAKMCTKAVRTSFRTVTGSAKKKVPSKSIEVI